MPDPAAEAPGATRRADSRPRFSLRLTLTLWMMAIFLVVQLSVAFMFEMYQRRSIDDFFDRRLESRLDKIVPELRQRLPDVTDEQVEELARRKIGLVLFERFVLNVYDEHGRLLAASRRPAADLPAGVAASVSSSVSPVALRVSPDILRDPEATTARSVLGWAQGRDGRRYIVLAATSDASAQEMLRLLSKIVLISIPIGVLAVAVSAYVISGIAVRPLREMKEVARSFDPDSLGEPVALSGRASEVKDLQRELDRARQRLELAFQAQERFMSNVSHELKTPIAVMLAELQALPVSGAPTPVRSFAASAAEELEKLARIVDSFLLLTRVRHGKAEPPAQELCLVREIIADACRDCKPMADERRVRFRLSLPTDIAPVMGNCDLLRTVLDNLIRNAVRFSPKGETVEVAAAILGHRLEIAVRDRGPGIPEELLPRIFDRFTQARSEERRGRGHGLGLEIALGIAELHGGTISASNREGGGAEFVVSLPIHPKPATPPSANG